MIVNGLRIAGFRNIHNLVFAFSPGRNLVFGRNGAGKTSVLEALFLTAFGKSFLNTTQKEMIRRGEEEFGIHLNVAGQDGRHQVSCRSSGQRLEIIMDEQRVTAATVRSRFYPIYFSSSTYTLEIESIPHLRRMVNRFICGVDPLYIRYILSYNRALKQKNHLLRFQPHAKDCSGWNHVLSEMGTRIVNTRQKFINDLNREIIEHGKETMNLRYSPSIPMQTAISSRDFRTAMDGVHEAESRYRRCLIGPHRDRFDILLNGESLKRNSSGEKKINLLLLYIAFIRLYYRVNRDYPVFLVDDYDSAMDCENVDVFMNAYPEMQILATSVNANRRFDQQVELARE